MKTPKINHLGMAFCVVAIIGTNLAIRDKEFWEITAAVWSWICTLFCLYFYRTDKVRSKN